MAHVLHCDRCQTVSAECASILSIDLCEACQSEFKAWVAAGAARARSRRSRERGAGRNTDAYLTVLGELAKLDDEVTTTRFGLALGCTARQAANRLKYMAKVGMIERVGYGLYRLPVGEAAE